jgi:TonB family protein
MIATWKQHEGQAVDGIVLLQLLGSGESSAVFLAERAGERCAIKLVPTEDVVAQLPLSRWEQASKLSHPHLSRIFQCGRANLDGVSLVYVAMEFAEDELGGVDRPLTPKEAREMLTPAAKALAYLHGKGFAHGRIRPSNILSVHDELKISGDAPLRKGERHASTPGGQPYDAPELAASGVTPAGDMWSLGISLVEAMTKELPKLDGGVPRLPDSLRPDSFRELAAGCLERDPARRWSIADLMQWLERGTIPSPKRPRPRYVVPIAAAAGVAALSVVAWVYAGPYLASSEALRQASESPASVAPAATAPSQSPPPAQPEPPAKPGRSTPAKVAKLPPRETKPAPLPETEPADPAPTPPPVAASASHAVAPDAAAFPNVVQPVIPDVPGKSVATIHGKVPIVVRVETDASGAVTSAKVESGGSSKYFADMALKAARQWKFVPGADARQWMLRFEFSHDSQHPVAAKVILAP